MLSVAINYGSNFGAFLAFLYLIKALFTPTIFAAILGAIFPDPFEPFAGVDYPSKLLWDFITCMEHL
jgi:hypothetical protein